MSKSGIPIVSDVGKLGGQIVKPLAPILKTVAPILPFLPIPGLGPLSSLVTKSLLTGIASGLDKSGNFNFNRGLKAGALAYGIGSLMNAANANTLTGAEGGVGSAADPTGLDLSGVPEGVTPATITTPSGDVSLASSYTGAPSTAPITSSGFDMPAAPVPAGQPAPVTDLSFQPNSIPAAAPVSTGEGLANLAGAVGETGVNMAGRALDYAVANPITTALGATTAYGSYKSMQELEKAKEEADRILQDQENKKASDIAWAQSVLRDYPLEYKRLSAADVRAQMGMASGGLAALAGGGVARYFGGGKVSATATADPNAKFTGDFSGMSNSFGGNAFKKLFMENPDLVEKLRGVGVVEEGTIPEGPRVVREPLLGYRRLTSGDVDALRSLYPGLYGREEDRGFASGGRFLEGPGDGTSDSIPARIGGRQEARLADGEFVVDARTVSELGNGSSKAGAKKLYAMMDRVHAARRGAKRGKPSGADKYMPA